MNHEWYQNWKVFLLIALIVSFYHCIDLIPDFLHKRCFKWVFEEVWNLCFLKVWNLCFLCSSLSYSSFINVILAAYTLPWVLLTWLIPTYANDSQVSIYKNYLYWRKDPFCMGDSVSHGWSCEGIKVSETFKHSSRSVSNHIH